MIDILPTLVIWLSYGLAAMFLTASAIMAIGCVVYPIFCILNAIKKARELKMKIIGLTGINDINMRNICDIIKNNTGGLLLIDYGYTEKKMKNTLQAISNHKFANILEDFGNVLHQNIEKE